MAFSTRLPDPAYQRHFSGQNVHTNTSTDPDTNYGDYGPGFASVKVVSDQKVMVSRTNSQRVQAKAVAGQKWNIDIEYHPMTQAEFRPVDAFLQMKQGAITPFHVALPQYNNPVNAAWVTDIGNYTFSTQSATGAGSTSLVIGANSWNPNSTHTPTNQPLPGEMFTITDSSDTNHTKAYMITYVENRYIYNAGSQPSSTARMHLGISPPLAKDVSTGSTFTFINPLFKVIMPTAVRSYSLNTDNLYKFSLKLEEYL